MEDNAAIKERIFKQILEQNKTLKTVLMEIEALRQQKELIKKQPKKKHHKKVIKDINKRLNELSLLKQKMPVIRPVKVRRNRWGLEITRPEPVAKPPKEKRYVFQGSVEKPKKTQTTPIKMEKMQSCHDTRPNVLRQRRKEERKRKREAKKAKRKEHLKKKSIRRA